MDGNRANRGSSSASEAEIRGAYLYRRRTLLNAAKFIVFLAHVASQRGVAYYLCQKLHSKGFKQGRRWSEQDGRSAPSSRRRRPITSSDDKSQLALELIRGHCTYLASVQRSSSLHVTLLVDGILFAFLDIRYKTAPVWRSSHKYFKNWQIRRIS